MNIVPILFYNFIEFIILLHTFLVISYAQYREYVFCLISFSKFLDVCLLLLVQELLVIFEAFFLGVNILRLEWSETLQSETLATRAMRAKSEENFLPFFVYQSSRFFQE